jgi:energy-coupling factor transporter ATP-binding protein EcfA2
MPIQHETSTPGQSVEGGIKFSVNDLKFTYPNGKAALKGVNFEIDRGEKVALVGPNGSGKSTLLLNSNGLLRGEGEVWVDEMLLDKKNIRLIRGLVGLVFQNPDDQLFSPTVYEDVAYGPLYMGWPEAEIHDRVAQALELVGLDDYRDRSPMQLSLGEKKRVSIATVLAMSPGLLAFDEPSAGLDPQARKNLIDLLGQLELTMLVATHDLLLVRDLFPRMILLDEGELIADGRTDELLADEVFLAQHRLVLP